MKGVDTNRDKSWNEILGILKSFQLLGNREDDGVSHDPI